MVRVRKYRTTTYTTWEAMIGRCTIKTNPSYSYYGGKGIEVCDRWKTYSNFYEDMGDKPDGTSLDRIDNSKGYSPENCKWSTLEEQNNNKSSNTKLTFEGKTQNLGQWAKELGVNRKTLSTRLRRGWSTEKALTN